MNPSQLRAAIESRGTESHFFDRATMRFFGDTMRNFGVRAVTVRAMGDAVNPETGKYELRPFDAWELYRRRPVKANRKGSFYFDRATLRRLHCVETD